MAEWTQRAILPNSVSYFASAVSDNQLYVIGGYDAQYTAKEYTQILNLDNLSWKTGAALPSPRSEAACHAVNGKVFLLGGYNNESDYPLGDIWAYDIGSNKWTLSGRLETEVYDFGSAVIGDNIFIVGGKTSPWNADSIKQIQVYNTISGQTQVYPVELSDARTDLTCESSGSLVYAIGGYSGNSGWVGQTTIINTSDASKKDGMIKSVLGPQYSTIYKDEIYTTSGQSNIIEKYSIENNAWSVWGTSVGTRYMLHVYSDFLISIPLQAASGKNSVYFTDLSSIAVLNPSPASGFVNEHQANTFTWELVTNPSSVTQKSAIFQWRPKGGTIRQIAITGATQSVTVPAETFPNGAIEWRVQATGSNNVASDFTAWMELTTIDQQPLAPVNLSPNSGQEDGTKPITFYWTHRSPLSTPQSAFEIQYTLSPDAEQPAWQALSGKVAGADGYFTVAANSIVPTDPTGKIGWRVRTYNSDNLAGPWSAPAYFIVHAAPQKPTIISVTPARSRPVVTWQSTGQVGYQLQVRNGDTVFYDSGETHGEQKQHAVASTGDVYLANGTYTVYLRIKNIRGLWSDWAEYSIVINAPRRMTITLEGESIENGAFLSWTNEVVT